LGARLEQLAHLAVPTNEGGWRKGLRRASSKPEHLRRTRGTSEPVVADPFARRLAGQHPMRDVADQYLVRFREGVELDRSLERDSPDVERGVPRRASDLAGDHESAVDADLDLVAAHRSDDLQRRARSPPRIVLPRLRMAEAEQDPVAHARRLRSSPMRRELGAAVMPFAQRCIPLLDIGLPGDRAQGNAAGDHRNGSSLAGEPDRLTIPRHLQLAVRGPIERAHYALDLDVALLRVLPCQDLEQAPEPVRLQPARQRKLLPATDDAHDAGVAIPFERVSSQQTLDQDQSPRVQIRSLGGTPTGELLGRRVQRRAHELSSLRQDLRRLLATAVDEPAESEVQDQRVPTRTGVAQHHVRRLQVAVKNSVAMGARQRVQHLRHQVERFARVHRTFSSDHLRQRLARHVLEDDVERARLAAARVQQAHHVRVGQHPDQLHLALEASCVRTQRHGGLVALDAQDLQCDELAGRQLPRPIDSTEVSRAELRLDLVAIREDGTERRARRERVRHCVRRLVTGAGAPPSRDLRRGKAAARVRDAAIISHDCVGAARRGSGCAQGRTPSPRHAGQRVAGRLAICSEFAVRAAAARASAASRASRRQRSCSSRRCEGRIWRLSKDRARSSQDGAPVRPSISP
jgi:hypothetical protein